MSRLPQLNGHEVLRILLKTGFYIHHQTGSHARLFHNRRPELRVTVPIHRKDPPEITMRRILKQADIEEADFLKLLKSQFLPQDSLNARISAR